MAWLGTWANRRKITIDNTNVDDNVTHYPLPVFLGTSVGTGADDVSDIFDEVGANSKKIAFTKDDGTTQLYAEIEYWDDSGESAVLWVSKSDWTIPTSGSGTEIYIYFDNTEADNTTYVNTPASGAAINVWDDNYVGAWHLGELSDGTTDEFKDSSSNGNHGQGETTYPDRTLDSKVGYAQSLDGQTNQINFNSRDSIDNVSPLTFSVWIKQTGITDTTRRIFEKRGTGEVKNLYIEPEGDLTWLHKTTGAQVLISGTTIIQNSVWYYITATWTGTVNPSGMHLYMNGINDDSGSVEIGSGTPLDDAAGDFWLGCRDTTDRQFYGIMDEARYSNVVRTAAWIKVDFYSQDDNIVSFSAAEHLYPHVNTIVNLFIGKINTVVKANIGKINTIPDD